jgi:branched-chain amino acid transport system ATP-binding protein
VPLLTLDQLSAGYGKLVVLPALSLSVEQGQFAGVIGPNGSGKSTLIKSVFGLTTLFGGAITLDGVSLVGLPTEGISRRGIAYVPQTRNVFTTLTIRENLLLAVRALGKGQANQALAEAFEWFPILGQRQAQRGGQLSGGERQMLAIAMAWLTRPRLMLLDEPTAGLAPLLVDEILRQLRRLAAAGITLLVVEQNARSLLRYCDYGFVLREGQVVFQGTAASLLADEDTAKNFLGVNSPLDPG